LNIRNKIAVFLLAMLVLFGSTGIPQHLHLCEGELYSAAIFVEPSACPHAQQKPENCPFHPVQDQSDQKDCCEDQTETLKTDELVGQPLIDLDFSKKIEFTLPYYLALFADHSSKENDCSTHFTSSPIVVYDVIALVQSFLL